MKIGIANDHGGLILKQTLTHFLESLGYNVINYGSDSDDAVDYPDFALILGEAIQKGAITYGIAICRTGIGMSIAMNKVKGIRCAKVENVNEALMSREHNDCNALAFSALTNSELAKEIVLTFITTNFSNEKRHINRIEKIREIENA